MKKSVTLAELMVGVLILALAGATVYFLMVNCVLLNEFNRNRTIAISHAEFILEEIKNADFSGPPSLENRINGFGGNPPEWDWNTNQIEAVFDPGDNIGIVPLSNEAINTDVNEISGGIGVGGNDLLDIGVTVMWQNRGGQVRSINLETLIAEP